ncbi:hypothetical protein [Streptomyces sp. TRM68367]|uniref:hypothetical protein n=1 Tax=Streptomyces sp. TRM68367 TaxID=2758415 RepID=UPI00165B4071|nr:hypothetical protein [Streptomyces sp. TRM68367]MBC9727585.1 hypothetical protein [Streptomyces sp. TRM68367]
MPTHTVLRWVLAIGLGVVDGDRVAANRRHGHAINGSDLSLVLLSACPPSW